MVGGVGVQIASFIHIYLLCAYMQYNFIYCDLAEIDFLSHIHIYKSTWAQCQCVT